LANTTFRYHINHSPSVMTLTNAINAPQSADYRDYSNTEWLW